MVQVNFRGKTFTREDVERAMDRFDQESRDSFQGWKKYTVKHNDKHYPPKKLFRMIVGDLGSPSGGEPVNRYSRDLGFQIGIGEVGDEPNTQPPVDEAIDTSLSLEADLEEALAANLAQLENGLQLYTEQSAFGRQFDAKAAGRIDLLAVDSQQNLVVVELKAGDADRQVCGQIQRTWDG